MIVGPTLDLQTSQPSEHFQVRAVFAIPKLRDDPSGQAMSFGIKSLRTLVPKGTSHPLSNHTLMAIRRRVPIPRNGVTRDHLRYKPSPLFSISAANRYNLAYLESHSYEKRGGWGSPVQLFERRSLRRHTPQPSNVPGSDFQTCQRSYVRTCSVCCRLPNPQLLRRKPLTPLPQVASPLECADTQTRSRKPFAMRSYSAKDLKPCGINRCTRTGVGAVFHRLRRSRFHGSGLCRLLSTVNSRLSTHQWIK